MNKMLASTVIGALVMLVAWGIVLIPVLLALTGRSQSSTDNKPKPACVCPKEKNNQPVLT